MRKQIFNLEFGMHCSEFTIQGYRFYRTKDYIDKVINLQHLVNGFAEYQTRVNTGSHQITAYVDLPKIELTPIFDWGFSGSALDDILLILSIFTLRDVFAVDDSFIENDNVAITADSRHYKWGGILRCSLPYQESEKNVSKYS